ncbi:MAG TPA: arsenosugar biosynthesis radical SAM (seleno)protein ArsS [Gammaproteobacteria bacterium]|nr:arsenosugar biosynthesis radical SAM (seleno)protein ArsS [Gammaproteobacteria bacterium]
MHATLPLLKNTDFPPLRRGALETVQVNMGYRCNQSCLHCHVNAGPARTEVMARETVDEVLAYLQASGAANLDITGGAPELNPHFRYLVERAGALGVHVMDRCNLTVLNEPGQQDLAEFLASRRVEVVASLPCYLPDNVDGQRGAGVYDGSMRALRRLNAQGYGRPGSGLVLNLVYNPVGPDLPPPQASLEADYRHHLHARYGIEFNHLFTLTNMPIQRFGSTLVSKGQFNTYMERLRTAYCPDNLQRVMCRTLISVDWQGRVYDCDFNQMLGLAKPSGRGDGVRLRDLMDTDLTGHPIAVADHCYGCTAGQGSSCGGAL